MEKNGQIRREIKNGIKTKGKDRGKKGQYSSVCAYERLLLEFSLCVRKFKMNSGQSNKREKFSCYCTYISKVFPHAVPSRYPPPPKKKHCHMKSHVTVTVIL